MIHKAFFKDHQAQPQAEEVVAYGATAGLHLKHLATTSEAHQRTLGEGTL